MKISLYSPIGISEIGHRPRQEDALCPSIETMSASDRVFVVCDGLGGHEHGDVASATVAHALYEKMTEAMSDGSIHGSDVTHAVKHAYEQLNDASRRFQPSAKPMGTTMAMLALGNNGVIAAHIGDSRIYHIRPYEKHVLYRSRDHSLVSDLFLAGKLTRSEAEASPKKSMLTRAMLPLPHREQVADVAFITNVEPGDYFLLCSDGVTATVTDEKLLEIFNDNSKGPAEKIATLQMLIQSSDDNRTAILLQVESVYHEADEVLLGDNEQQMCDKMVHEAVMPLAATATGMGAAAAATDSHASSHATPQAAVPPVPSSSPEEATIEPAEVTLDEGVEVEVADEGLPPMPDEEVATGDNGSNRLSTMWADKPTRQRLIGIAIATLVLVAGILAFFLMGSNGKTPAKKPVKDSLPDPDVTIDSIIPDLSEPVDSFDTGSAVAVPPAPAPPAADYPTGGSVSVGGSDYYYDGRVYEPDNDPNWSSGGDNQDDTPQGPAADQSPTKPQPQQQAQPSQPQRQYPRGLGGAYLQERDKNNGQSAPVGASNRNVAVPPPSRSTGSKPILTP